MQKLTQKEAQDLVKKAWEMVAEHTLGSYRFGQSLWNLIPENILYQYWVNGITNQILGWSEGVSFYYEQNPDIVISKFYQYFVEDSDN